MQQTSRVIAPDLGRGVVAVVDVHSCVRVDVVVAVVVVVVRLSFLSSLLLLL
jgi:hypothetical protein